MHVLLYHPEIPQNTGNIARTCCATGAKLTLVRPLGFSLAARHLRRAGMDYLNNIDLNLIDDLNPEEYLDRPIYFFSSHATRLYTDVSYTEDSVLVFGAETSGLPSEWRERWPDRFLTLPMQPHARCLNLSSSVAAVLYEGWRQQSFAQK